MKKILVTVFATAFTIMAVNTVVYAAPATTTQTPACSITQKEVDLSMAMRKLWEDHIVWTRNYIISAVATPQLGDLSAVTDRLMKNQDNIGSAIIPYYGADAGKKLTALLHDHIALAGEVVTAAKANDKTALDAAQTKWKANADDIATFLSGANPNWNKTDLTKMLYKHLELTTGEAASRLKQDWKADIAFYDKNHTHMLMFSDMLTDGIVKQFPDKFK